LQLPPGSGVKQIKMDDKEQFSGQAGDRNGGDKELWELLGRARDTKAGPMFSRNVMREIRQSGRAVGVWQRWIEFFRRPVFKLGVAAVAVCVAGLLVYQTQPQQTDQLGAAMVEDGGFIDPAHEFESIERLGELMAVSDPGTLSDEALFNLLF